MTNSHEIPHDVSEARKAPGRRPRAAQFNRTRKIEVRLTEEEYNGVIAQADAAGQSASTFCRRALKLT